MNKMARTADVFKTLVPMMVLSRNYHSVYSSAPSAWATWGLLLFNWVAEGKMWQTKVAKLLGKMLYKANKH